MSMSARIREVLEQHPFIAGEDFYAGALVCASCHLVTDPAQHLHKFLAQALDPEYAEPAAPSLPLLGPAGQRESTIGWED